MIGLRFPSHTASTNILQSDSIKTLPPHSCHLLIMTSICSVGSRSVRFTENSEGSAFMAQLRKQRIECRFCDIVLLVGDRCFAAHRNVLAASSAYFDSILTTDKAKREEFRINHCDAELVLLVLDYMYSGGIVLDQANVRPLIDLADFLIMPTLKGYCEEYFRQNVSLESCLLCKELSAMYKLIHLAAAVRLFIRKNMAQVLDLSVVSRMNFHRYRELIVEANSGHCSISPLSLLNTIVLWIKQDIPDRSTYFASLIEGIFWNEIPFPDLVEHINSESLYQENKLCFHALLRSLVSSDVDLGQFDHEYQMLDPIYNELGNSRDIVPSCDEEDSFLLTFDSEPITLEIISSKSCSSPHQNDHLPDHNANFFSKKETMSAKSNTLVDDVVGSSTEFRDCVSDEADLSSDESGESCVEKEQMMTLWDAEMDGILTCPHCNFSAATATRLEQHVAVVHEEDQTYRCKICCFECKWNRDYFKHMREHFTGPPYRCDDCDFVCHQIRNLVSHRVSHIDDQSHSCSHCNFMTNNRSDLLIHSKIHADDKPHRCHHCGRSFGHKHTLDQHLETHSLDTSQPCHSCSFSKKYASHSLPPKRGCSDVSIFHCPQPNCSYHSPRRSQLAAHTRSHLSIRSHVCNTCGRGFIEKSHLIRHERIHLKEKPFKCDTCDYCSTRRDKLKEHIQKHHPLAASARDLRRTRRSGSSLFGAN